MGTHRRRNAERFIRMFLFMVLVSGVAQSLRPDLPAYAVVGVSPSALTVYGQGGSFTTNTANNGGVSASSLNNPQVIAFDSSGNLYIADTFNNRVLYYPVGSTTATRVYGQGGLFTTNTANNGGVSASSLNIPVGLALDSSGNLYIADSLNNRVLYYPAGSTTATRVYGQGGLFTTNTANNGGVSASSLNIPVGLALDSSGNLYIADSLNNRVLYYPAGSTTATRVYGQGGLFTTNTANNGGVSASSLNDPQGIALDSSGNLYIADYNNNRVLYYPAGSTTATRVYGQGGLFTTNTANNGGVSASSLNTPVGLALDSSGNLYIADYNNNRVLYYPAGSTTATRVYGQGGLFTTNTANNGGVSASSLNTPQGIALDSTGDLYVASSSNNRVLYYSAGSTTATRVYGQGGLFTTTSASTSATGLSGSTDVALDSSGDIDITDALNNRVLQFKTALNVTTQPPSSTPATSPFTVASQLIDVGSGGGFTDFTGTVSIAIKAGTGTTGASLNGTTAVSAVNGSASFTNLTVQGGTGYILTISSPGVGSANTNAFTSVAGTLIFTYLTSPTFTFTLTGATRTITSQHTFKVNDTVGTGVGWHVNITSTQFVSGANTLPTTALTITGVTTACTAGQTCVVPVNGVNTYPITVPSATTAPAAVAYMSANGVTGTGDVTVTTTFSLSIPPGTASGTYTSTVTETVVNASSYYNIINRNSGLNVDVSGASPSDGGSVIQYPNNGGTNQQWQLIDVGGGYDKIVAHHSGKALDVSGSSLVTGAAIVQNGYTGLTSQQWQLVSVGGGYVKIVNRNSGMVLDVPGGATSSVGLDQAAYTGATSQQWRFFPLP